MDTIIFANNEVHSCTFMSTIPEGNSNAAFIAIDDIGFVEAASLFSDDDKTSIMQWRDLKLVGYTNLSSISVQPYGIQAVLRGGHNEPRE